MDIQHSLLAVRTATGSGVRAGNVEMTFERRLKMKWIAFLVVILLFGCDNCSRNNRLFVMNGGHERHIVIFNEGEEGDTVLVNGQGKFQIWSSGWNMCGGSGYKDKIIPVDSIKVVEDGMSLSTNGDYWDGECSDDALVLGSELHCDYVYRDTIR